MTREDEVASKHASTIHLAILEKSKEAKSFQFALTSEEKLRDLLDNQVLKKTDANLIVDFERLDCVRLAYLLLEKEYQVPVFRSLPEIIEFVGRVLISVEKLGIRGSSKFAKYLIRQTVVANFNGGTLTTNDFLSISKIDTGFFRFVQGISESLSDLLVDEKKKLEIFSHFWQQCTQDAGYLSVVAGSLKEYSSSQEVKLLEFDAEHLRITGFGSVVLSGTYSGSTGSDNFWVDFSKLPLSWQDEKLRFLSSFIAQSRQEIEEINAFLSQANIRGDECGFLVSIYVNIINSESCLAQMRELYCSKLFTVYDSKNEAVGLALIQELHRLNGYDQEKEKIILGLDFSNVKLHGPLNYRLPQYDHRLAFKVIREVIIAQGLEFDEESFDYTIHEARTSNTSSFDTGLVSLLLDHKGVVRFKASRILHYYEKHHRRITFNIDLNSYTLNQQVRLLDTFLLDYVNPEAVIVHTLALRNSTHPDVLQALVNCLGILIEDFCGLAVQLIKSNLNAEVAIEAEILRCATEYYEQLKDIMVKKNPVPIYRTPQARNTLK